ncbi:MAG: outer membrane lipoprotein-sorting protein [Acidobacteriota bacterium]
MRSGLLIAAMIFAVLGNAAGEGGADLELSARYYDVSARPSRISRQVREAREIIAGSQQVFYASGTDMYARVQMVLVTQDGRTRERELTMLRKNFAAGEQRYYIYFHRPSDVRGTTFMVWKYPERDDDRWIYVPAINLVRRIAADDARSSFVGSDFNYEDVSGRDVGGDEHRLVREDSLDSRPVFVVESRPVRPADYERKVSWIDQATQLPLREEYYDVQGTLYRVFTSDEIRMVAAGPTSVATVVKRTMRNIKTGHRTEVTFSEVKYDVGLGDDLFTEASLRRPPRRWIR